MGFHNLAKEFTLPHKQSILLYPGWENYDITITSIKQRLIIIIYFDAAYRTLNTVQSKIS
ncbi:hypothetical protein SPPR111872_16730 [Sphingobacterium prati]